MAFYVPMTYQLINGKPHTVRLAVGDYLDNSFIYISPKAGNNLRVDADDGGLYASGINADAVDRGRDGVTSQDPSLPTTVCGDRSYLMGKPSGWIDLGNGLGIAVHPIVPTP